MSTWVRRLRIVALVGGHCLMDYGLRNRLAAPSLLVEEDPNAGVTKNWDIKLPNTLRFTVLMDFGGAAVRDNETGLVWEQSPETKTQNWSRARFQCTKLTTVGRKGWRLHSVHELASLVDPLKRWCNSTARLRSVLLRLPDRFSMPKPYRIMTSLPLLPQ